MSPDIIRAIQDGHVKEEMMGEVTFVCSVSVIYRTRCKVHFIGDKFGL